LDLLRVFQLIGETSCICDVHLPFLLRVRCCVHRKTANLLYQYVDAAADVTGGNVLLQRSRQRAAGFNVKLADFGMARDFSVKDRIETRMYGTVTHMPPELIESGIASKAVDIYALVRRHRHLFSS
jgi:serine/threonine protein kinase